MNYVNPVYALGPLDEDEALIDRGDEDEEEEPEERELDGLDRQEYNEYLDSLGPKDHE